MGKREAVHGLSRRTTSCSCRRGCANSPTCSTPAAPAFPRRSSRRRRTSSADRRPNCSCASSFGISLLAINRDKNVLRADIRQMPLRAGDMLVLHSIWTDLAQAGGNRDFVVVTDYPKQRTTPAEVTLGDGLFVASMSAGAEYARPGADRIDGWRRGDDRRRRAEHGRSLCGDELEDRVPDGLPDPAGLGDGLHRRGELDGAADARTAAGPGCRSGDCRPRSAC